MSRPRVWEGDALFLPKTRAAFRKLENLGFTDAARSTTDEAGLYSFWDYQAGAWPKNNGIRIDHLMLSAEAADRLESVSIEKHVRAWEKPSDHVPVCGYFDFSPAVTGHLYRALARQFSIRIVNPHGLRHCDCRAAIVLTRQRKGLLLQVLNPGAVRRRAFIQRRRHEGEALRRLAFLEDQVAENRHGAGMAVFAGLVEPFLCLLHIRAATLAGRIISARRNWASATPKVEATWK